MLILYNILLIRLYKIIKNGNETDFKHHILSYSLIYVVVLYMLSNNSIISIVITTIPLLKSLKNKNIKYIKKYKILTIT